MSDLTDRALEFATLAHAAVGQKRKYTGEDYIVHPIEVSETIRNLGGDDEQIAAALLHDVVEDTSATIEQVREAFGDNVGDLVEELTDVAVPSDGNRKARMAINLQHTAKASARGQTIKLADIKSNFTSITLHDPGFAFVWVREKRDTLEILRQGNRELWNEVDQMIRTYLRR